MTSRFAQALEVPLSALLKVLENYPMLKTQFESLIHNKEKKAQTRQRILEHVSKPNAYVLEHVSKPNTGILAEHVTSYVICV